MIRPPHVLVGLLNRFRVVRVPRSVWPWLWSRCNAGTQLDRGLLLFVEDHSVDFRAEVEAGPAVIQVRHPLVDIEHELTVVRHPTEAKDARLVLLEIVSEV